MNSKNSTFSAGDSVTYSHPAGFLCTAFVVYIAAEMLGIQTMFCNPVIWVYPDRCTLIKAI